MGFKSKWKFKMKIDDVLGRRHGKAGHGGGFCVARWSVGLCVAEPPDRLQRDR